MYQILKRRFYRLEVVRESMIAFFYGKYEYAKVWATKRFEFIPDFLKYFLNARNDGRGQALRRNPGRRIDSINSDLLAYLFVCVAYIGLYCWSRVCWFANIALHRH